ncbi:hypothetical protein FHW83_004747 [Duganella sp. SG902]|uniref:hypothetical protein n=1 Tax=Duganella sp. SG902 TaxID=2587016 RepID=UPI00159DE737|nr:hypothetical protein [Duganella sp. SG902]NVM78916.1 hypothetical protein [Duganella sp. SG902]
MPQLTHIATATKIEVAAVPQWISGTWECGDQRFTDIDKDQYSYTPAPPTVGPNEFYFRWTMQEQIAIEALRSTDDVVKLFMRRLDDPRTTEVVLADPAVQGAVQHTVMALVAANVIPADQADQRIAAIIGGGAQ